MNTLTRTKKDLVADLDSHFEQRAKVIADLKACSTSRNLEKGRNIHQAAIQNGDDSNVYIASTLMYMYAKCGRVEEAHKVFDHLKHPNVVCWNALIFAYVDNGKSEMALELFTQMDCPPNVRTFVAAFKACGNLAEEGNLSCQARGKKLHILALGNGCYDSFVQSTLVDMYSKCGSMQDARIVFDRIINPDVVCWTTIILGHADNGEGHISLDYFFRMHCEGCPTNAITIVGALKACTDCALKEEGNKKIVSEARGKKLHLQALAIGQDDIHVQVTLVDLYAKCGSMQDAHRVFDSVSYPEVMSWTALISGYADNGEGEVALKLFLRMYREGCEPDARTFLAAVKACVTIAWEEEGPVKVSSRNRGKMLQLLVLRSGCNNLYVQVSLVDAFSKCGCMEDARIIFDRMRHPDVVSWTALISGYTNNGKSDAALYLFSQMTTEGCVPNSFTYSAALKACGTLGALELGKAFHAEINSTDFRNNPVLGNSLLDFYSKCGSLAEAEQVFESHATKNLITWNSLMSGYSRHGDSGGVFSLFERMLDRGFQPDEITFKCILVVCSHAGLVDMGMASFEDMSRKYGLNPDIEHYNIIIDILCRAHKLDDALVLLRNMPFNPNGVTWMTALGECSKRNNVVLGRLAFESVINLEDGNGGAYILMTNMYGRRGMWADQAKLQAMRLNLTLQRKQEQSWWTNEKGVVHMFIHPPL